MKTTLGVHSKWEMLTLHKCASIYGCYKKNSGYRAVALFILWSRVITFSMYGGCSEYLLASQAKLL